MSVIELQSDDYAADCAAQWKLRGVDPPPLVAYERPTSNGPVVEVVPASEDVPSSWAAVDGVSRGDMALIELESSMDDYVDGLLASCREGTVAKAFAREELDRLRLTSWHVVALMRGPMSARQPSLILDDPSCGFDPATTRDNRVRRPTRGRPYAVALRDNVAGQCLDLAAAMETAQRLANRIDAERATKLYEDAPLSEGLLVTAIADNDRVCTAVDLNVYGIANLKLRGPESESD